MSVVRVVVQNVSKYAVVYQHNGKVRFQIRYGYSRVSDNNHIKGLSEQFLRRLPPILSGSSQAQFVQVAPFEQRERAFRPGSAQQGRLRESAQRATIGDLATMLLQGLPHIIA